MNRFVNKVAVVTGASRGIGEEISKELLRRGVNVVGLVENSGELQHASEIFQTQPESYKGKFTAFICDISQEKEIIETFSKIKSTFGSIAILVNNAGIALPVANKMSELRGEDFSRVFDVNVKGLCLCSNEAVKLMTERSVGGHIVNVNSTLSLPHLSASMVPVYSVSKKAARAFSESLRSELIKDTRNIKITNLSPGLVNTNLPRMHGLPVPDDSDRVLSVQDVANGCIAILDTPPHVVVLEYTVVAKYCDFQ
ncbi:hypothetical protein V9T40_004698 [Parthenolecanium corni]|uniref:Farnesol dehydrogenase-like n=1 Tax=Parthenolecanium corni TaxID=536013 RepID=A0AAN9TEY8_9HEMI